jgi:glycine/D-amino acid oxidase-like deaminating enzyme
VLFFFPTEEPYVRDSIAAHKEFGLSTDVLDQAEMTRRFPMIDFEGIRVGLYEPGFGALMARRSVQTLVDRFVKAGGAYVKGAAQPLQSSADRLSEVDLSSGERIAADRFVFALGPWLPKLFPGVIGLRIIATRQEVFFFAPPAGDRRFLPGAMPGWADFNGGDIFYGFPDLESRGVKFAHDAHGVQVDPDTQDRRPTEAALAEIVAFRDHRFPLLRGAPLTEARVCQYENSSNGDFLIDFHPRLSNVLLVGAGSGHGFKHGPEVGRYAAARLTGSITPEPRFSLATKTETHHREVH